jgi:glycosyltransferase involved in cell wall biosynthesis
MQVTVSVSGRFHAFYLARQLQERGILRELITSYPKFETVKYGLVGNKVRSLPAYEVLQRLWRKLPLAVRCLYPCDYWLGDLFDRHAATTLKRDGNIFVGWSAGCLNAIRQAKELGMITVVERGSSHMLTQLELLREEYGRHGVKFVEHHPVITRKELKEYDEADYISIPSLFVKRTFLERGFPEERLLHNPYGVDLTHFYPVAKEDSIFRVIYCGALSIRKGIGYLLQAFSELRLPGAELWLIGSRQPETESLLRRFESPYIRHLGPFREFELYKYYSQGSVFCMPSIEEGLAMVQPQAMACGLPLVCTTNTGGEDLIDDGKEGFVVPIRDVEALKEKILFLYENPDICRTMGMAARLKVQKGFTWFDYGERMSNFYQRMLG